MPNLNVVMTLSLIDSASPQARSFIGLLERLEVVAKSVSQAMAGIGSIGGGGGRGGITEANVQAWGRMVSMAEQMNGRIDQMKGKIQGAAQSMDQAMTQAMGRAQSAAERMDTAITGRSQGALRGTANQQMAAALENERRAALAGGVGRAAWAATSTAELATLERGLRSARVESEGLNQSFVGMGDTLKGLAAIWGALKIEGFLKSSVNAAADFQTELAKLRSTGVGPDIAAAQEAAAFRDSSRLPFASPLDALKMRQAMMAGSAERGETPMSQNILDQVTPALLSATNALRMMGDKADITQIGRNLVSLFEERGITTNVQRMQQTLDMIVNTFSVTQGKVTPTDWDVFARRFGSGISQISDEGLRNMAAFINQMKVMGGEAGGGVGGGASSLATAMKQLEAMALGKPIVGQARQMWIESGAFEAVAGRKGLTAREPDLITKDPIGFFIKYAPNIIEYTRRYMKEFYAGKDQNDPEAQAAAMQKFLAMTGITVTTQQAAMLAMNPATSERMQKQSAQIGAAPGVKGINDIFAETYRQQIVNFDAAINKLQMTLGNAFLPTLTEVIKGVVSFVQSIAEFNRQFPDAAKIEGIGLVLLGLAAAFIAVQKLFGPFGIAFSTLFGSMGAAATAGGAAAEGAMVGLFARLAGIVKFGLGAMTAAFIGWNLGKLILGTDFGQRVEETLSRLFDMMGRGGLSRENAAALSKAAYGSGEGANVLAPGELDSYRHMERASAQEGATKRRFGGLAAPLGEPAGPKGRGGGYEYSADQVEAREDTRLDEEDRREKLRELQAAYHAGTIGVSEYYEAIVQGSRDAAAAVIVDKQIQIEAIEAKSRLTNRDKGDIERLKTDQKIALRRYESESAVAEENQKRDMLALDRKSIDYEREMMTVSGHRHDAELLHMREEMQAKQALLIAEGRLTPDKAAADLEKATAAMRANQGVEEIRLKQERSRNLDLEIDNQVKASALTEEEAARKKHENAVALALDLQTLIDKYIELARVAGNDQLVVQLQAMKIQAHGVLTELGPDAVAARNVMDGAFRGLFSNLITGTKSIKAAFADFFKSLAQGFADIASKQLSGQIMKMLFGGGGGGAADNFFSGKWLSSLGGGGGGGGLMDWLGLGGGGGSTFSTPFGFDSVAGPFDMFGIGSFATGIDYVPRDMFALVHEGEKITPKSQNKGGGGQMVYSPTFVISENVNTKSRAQVEAAAYAGAQRSHSRTR